MKILLSIILFFSFYASEGQSKKVLYEQRSNLIGQIGVYSLRYFDLTTEDDSLIFQTLSIIQDLIGKAKDVNDKIKKRARGWELKETNIITMTLISWEVENSLMLSYITEVLEGMEERREDQEAIIQSRT